MPIDRPESTTAKELPPHFSLTIWVLLVMMAICLGRATVSQNINLLNLNTYAHLKEKSPFQERILMAPVIRAAEDSRLFLRLYDVGFSKTVESPEDLVVSLSNCVCLVLLLPVVVALRRAFSPAPRTTWLAPLFTLLVVAFTYVVRYEQRFTMPYDLLSLLLYTVGLLAIARRQGWLLLAVLAVGTPNRETVVFLIPMWFWMEWREDRRVSALAYSFAGLAVWFSWRWWIAHILHSQHGVYDFPWRSNIMSIFVPFHWPQLFSIFGFLAIPMWMLRRYVLDSRLRALWISTTPFLLAGLFVGVWRETRIFGELSGLIGLTFALQLDAMGDRVQPKDGLERSHVSMPIEAKTDR